MQQPHQRARSTPHQGPGVFPDRMDLNMSHEQASALFLSSKVLHGTRLSHVRSLTVQHSDEMDGDYIKLVVGVCPEIRSLTIQGGYEKVVRPSFFGAFQSGNPIRVIEFSFQASAEDFSRLVDVEEINVNDGLDVEMLDAIISLPKLTTLTCSSLTLSRRPRDRLLNLPPVTMKYSDVELDYQSAVFLTLGACVSIINVTDQYLMVENDWFADWTEFRSLVKLGELRQVLSALDVVPAFTLSETSHPDPDFYTMLGSLKTHGSGLPRTIGLTIMDGSVAVQNAVKSMAKSINQAIALQVNFRTQDPSSLVSLKGFARLENPLENLQFNINCGSRETTDTFWHAIGLIPSLKVIEFSWCSRLAADFLKYDISPSVWIALASHPNLREIYLNNIGNIDLVGLAEFARTCQRHLTIGINTSSGTLLDEVKAVCASANANNAFKVTIT